MASWGSVPLKHNVLPGRPEVHGWDQRCLQGSFCGTRAFHLHACSGGFALSWIHRSEGWQSVDVSVLLPSLVALLDRIVSWVPLHVFHVSIFYTDALAECFSVLPLFVSSLASHMLVVECMRMPNSWEGALPVECSTGEGGSGYPEPL